MIAKEKGTFGTLTLFFCVFSIKKCGPARSRPGLTQPLLRTSPDPDLILSHFQSDSELALKLHYYYSGTESSPNIKFLGGISPGRPGGYPQGTEKAHKLFQHKLFGPHPKPPNLGPQKKFMCLISWERTQKGDPHKLFRAEFWGQKGCPKRAIFGHKKFSLLFFSCP